MIRRAGKLFRLLLNPRYRRALRYRVAAAIEHEHVLRRVAVATVVDIGANKGQFSLTAAEAWPGATLVAFEPIPAAAAVFRKVFAASRRASLHQCAIGESETTAKLHISQRLDSSSLLPIGALQESIFPGTAEQGTLEVRVCRLGAAVDAADIRPDALLKLDVQGYELQALRGCEDLLPAFRYVYVECSFIELYQGQALADEVIDYLDAHGFHETGRHNLVTDDDGQPVQADLWFERRAAA